MKKESLLQRGGGVSAFWPGCMANANLPGRDVFQAKAEMNGKILILPNGTNPLPAAYFQKQIANSSVHINLLAVAENSGRWIVLQRRMKRVDEKGHQNRISVSMKAEYPICSGELPLLRRFSRFASLRKELHVVCYQGFLLVVLRNVRLNANVWSCPLDLLSREVYTFFYRNFEHIEEEEMVELFNEYPVETKQLRLCASDSISDISSKLKFELINLQRGRSRKLAIHPINEWFKSKHCPALHIIGAVLVYITSDSVL
ncbi:hypothetical protein T05_8542 [Trichinella murrelli]|uniref:Uncharacterized protein n=1 Tax=Trichinella murrelli TaxID=144512 RepID=A0A0V0TGY4_9BILA|nr:hypothetical protein T05_8542 [Trichinella murrelli]